MKKSNKVTRVVKIKNGLLGLYYGHPIKDMKLICITGSTGTVEVANFVHETLKAAGHPVAILASEAPLKMGALHKFISNAWKTGANYVIVTASTESLKKGVFYNLPVHIAAMTNFDPSVTTNLTEEENLDAISTLFSMQPEYVILNRDDANYLKFSEFAGTKGTLSYGKDRYSNINISSSKLYKKGTEADLAIGNSHFTVASFLAGEPVVSYMAATTAIADALHVTPEKIAEGIANYEPIPAETPVTK